MSIIEKVVFTWSGGKDSAMALHKLKKSGNYQILALLTTLTEDYDRISMHGVKRILLEEQADSLGIPLEKVYIQKNSSNEEFELKMKDALLRYRNQGVQTVVFGDIFLENVRKYREENLAKIGMKAIFPIWKKKTEVLVRNFIDLGFKAIITCVDGNILGEKFVGMEFNKQFLSQLPSGVDPCGENGEFHSFVFDGPLFKGPISYERGIVVTRENRFHYCDLNPARIPVS